MRNEMTNINIFALIITAAVCSATVAHGQSSQAPTIVPVQAADLGSTSKRLSDEALKLKEETAQGLKKLDDLAIKLKDQQQDTVAAGKTVEELLSLLKEAASRLDSDGVYRKTLDAQKATVAGIGNEAEAHPDTEIRNRAPWFKTKADEIGAISSEAEQLRLRLIAQIQRLEEAKERLRFAISAAHILAFINNARAYLDNIGKITDGAKGLADNLGNTFGTTLPTQ